MLDDPGTSAVCIRKVQKSLMQSSKRLIELKIQQLGVSSSFAWGKSEPLSPLSELRFGTVVR